MSLFSENVRAVVVARASNRCEYCLLPALGQVGRFPIDHVIPRSSGGRTELGNLALACPSCNARKWAHTKGMDSTSGEVISLFNPRTDRWSDHFTWSVQQPFQVEGKTPCGRATVARLELNRADMLTVRRLLAALGLFPEPAGSASS